MAKPTTVKIRSSRSESTGFFYVTKKNPRNIHREDELPEIYPVARKHCRISRKPRSSKIGPAAPTASRGAIIHRQFKPAPFRRSGMTNPRFTARTLLLGLGAGIALGLVRAGPLRSPRPPLAGAIRPASLMRWFWGGKGHCARISTMRADFTQTEIGSNVMAGGDDADARGKIRFDTARIRNFSSSPQRQIAFTFVDYEVSPGRNAGRSRISPLARCSIPERDVKRSQADPDRQYRRHQCRGARSKKPEFGMINLIFVFATHSRPAAGSFYHWGRA